MIQQHIRGISPVFYILTGIWIILGQQSFAQLPAFPEAEGFGKYAVGGRGGKVIEVTNLNDAGTGSLRDACAQKGARTVVFRVSGTIFLKSTLKLANDSITIAGQTAPGDGICLGGFDLYNTAKHVIIRYLRFRLGDTLATQNDAVGGRQGSNIILDHCSASWSEDETFSFYENTNFTAQWCIMAESMYNSKHPKGAHGYGGIWGGTNASWHHNLIANHSSRTPRFSGAGTTVACFNVDFHNNMIYNWGFDGTYGGEGSTVNIIANYYKPGPATKTAVRTQIVRPYDAASRWYLSGNVMEGSASVTANNALGLSKNNGATDSSLVSVPFPSSPLTTQTAQDAVPLVLAYAGAVLPKRDALDARYVDEAQNGTVHFGAKSYPRLQGLDTNKIYGIIDSQNDVGGWPVLNSTVPPVDSDHDGIPDSWETEHGLNPADATDRNKLAPSGYTWLEEYLNQIGNPMLSDIKTVKASAPTSFSLLQNYPNPFNPTTEIQFTVAQSVTTTLKIYDILGNEVATLFNEMAQPGNVYHRIFSAANLSTGVYVSVLHSGSQNITRKMLLLK